MKNKPHWLYHMFLSIPLAASCADAQVPTPVQPSPPGAHAPSAQEENEARIELGERFCDLALTLARSAHYSKPALQQSAALLEAATRMNPLEPRFARLLAATRRRTGDIEGAINAWKDYRKLIPDDRVAQVELIDLYLDRLQSNDEKLKYLNGLLSNSRIDGPVKAHIAVTSVPLLEQRSHDEAMAMLAQAKKYYPLPEVTLLELQMLPASATPMQRAVALLNVLKANPSHSDAIAEVADMLASAGLSEAAINWYSILMDVHARQGTSPSMNSLVNYLAERYRAGETTVAAEQLDSMLQKDPLEAEFWFLRLTIQRGDESAQTLKQAQATFLTRLDIICKKINTESSHSSTRESGAAPAAVIAPTTGASAPGASLVMVTNRGDIPLAEAMKHARESADPQFKEALVRSLADLGWFEVYFDHKADAAAPWIDALKELVPQDNVSLRRLQAWSDLVSGNVDSARPIFTAQAATDPLSMLGLFRLLDAAKDKGADGVGRQILSEPHGGVIGAILWQATKGRGLKPAAPPAQTAMLQAEIDKFPKDWLQVVHEPKKFYALRLEPVKVGHRLGEPLLAIVTIQNSGTQDLTIGDYGLIKPLMVFDAQIRGGNSQVFPAVAIDKIMGQFVLPAGQSITQTVRIDQGALSDILQTRPGVMMLINADVVTNAQQQAGQVAAQPGGYAQNVARMFTRSPAPLVLDSARRKLFAELATGSPGEKMMNLELLAAYVRQYSQPGATDAEKASAQQYIDAIDKSKADPSPGAKLWASYLEAVLVAESEEQKLLDQMLASNAWESRLLAMVAARYLPFDAQKQIASKLKTQDPDALVQAYASALLDMLETLPARSSATEPSGAAPSTAPSDSVLSPATAPSAVPTTRPADGALK